MLVPVVRKVITNPEALIERALPAPGMLYCQVGQEVKPFDRLGVCTVSYKRFMLPTGFVPNKSKLDKQFYYFGALLGKSGSKKVTAPYNGYLFKDGASFAFDEVENKFLLLSGVWGTVEKIHENKSVLVKTKTKDLLLAASTTNSVTGELVIFPNPTEILEEYYLEEFSKEARGKIVYVGHYASDEVIKKAVTLGAGGIVAGSTSRETFAYAKANNLALGVIMGFGKIETPEPVFKLLNQIAYRQILLQGERNLLRIPIPVEEWAEPGKPADSKPIKKLAKKMKVQVFQKPYFGKIGSVDSIGDYSIFVKFDDSNAPVEIRLPNFYIIE